MIELLIFIFALLAMTAGGMLANKKWSSSASNVQRNECGGKLYWVIEDGDKDKLDHVVHCFDRQRSGGGE